jgi:hypothetical protein
MGLGLNAPEEVAEEVAEEEADDGEDGANATRRALFGRGTVEVEAEAGEVPLLSSGSLPSESASGTSVGRTEGEAAADVAG